MALSAHKVNIDGDSVWLGTTDRHSRMTWSLEDVLDWRCLPQAEKARIVAHNISQQQAIEALWLEVYVKDGKMLPPNGTLESVLQNAVLNLEYMPRMLELDRHEYIPLTKGRAQLLDPRLLEIKRLFDDGPDPSATIPKGEALAFLMQVGCHGAATCTEIADKACAKCLVATYCSRACQKSHWKSHKADCKSAASAAAATVSAGSGGGGGGSGSNEA